MNNIYANRNGIPVNTTKQDESTRAVDKLIERDRKSRERSTQILDYFKNQRNYL